MKNNARLYCQIRNGIQSIYKKLQGYLIGNSRVIGSKDRLSYLRDTRGFGVLTGEPGRGKTTAARTWAASLNPSLFKVFYSSLSSLTVMDFYRQIASGLGAEPRFRKNDFLMTYSVRSNGMPWKSVSLP